MKIRAQICTFEKYSLLTRYEFSNHTVNSISGFVEIDV